MYLEKLLSLTTRRPRSEYNVHVRARVNNVHVRARVMMMGLDPPQINLK